MNTIYIATATITTYDLGERIPSDINTVIIATNTSRTEAEKRLSDWLRDRARPGAELGSYDLAITEAEVNGPVKGRTQYEPALTVQPAVPPTSPR